MISREIFVLQIPIFECEPFLFSLTPLFKVKIDICTLCVCEREKERDRVSLCEGERVCVRVRVCV